jgi:hypothetical protein
MESGVKAAVGPDCGQEMKGGASCSCTGAHGTTGSDAAASLGDDAREASSERAHGSSAKTTPGRPAVGTKGDEDPVSTYTSKFTMGNKVIAET